MPRRRVMAPAMAAIDGKSVPCGWLDRKDAGRCDRPVSIKYVAASCPLLVCVNDRTSAQCRLRWASIGRCSQMWMPGVRVAIGLNSPLYSAGPRGFMSKVSCCEAPPVRNRKMTAFGRGVVPAGDVPRSRATSVIDNPRAPIVPAWRNARRHINGWRGLADVCIGLAPQHVVTDGPKWALAGHSGIGADRVEKTGMNPGRKTFGTGYFRAFGVTYCGDCPFDSSNC